MLYMEGPCRPAGGEGTHDQWYLIKTRKCQDWNLGLSWRKCTEKFASSNGFAPGHGFGRVTEVSKSYLPKVSLFTLAVLLFESWFVGSPVTV